MTSNLKNFKRLDNDDQKAFETYSSYLNGISKCCKIDMESLNKLLENICSSRSFKSIQCKKDINIEKVSKLLRNAWYTEFQLKNLSTNSEFSSFSLHWAQVYAY